MPELDETEVEAVDAALDQGRLDDYATVASHAERRLGDRLDNLSDAALEAVMGSLFDGRDIPPEMQGVIRDALLLVDAHARMGTLPRLLDRWYGAVRG